MLSRIYQGKAEREKRTGHKVPGKIKDYYGKSSSVCYTRSCQSSPVRVPQTTERLTMQMRGNSIGNSFYIKQGYTHVSVDICTPIYRRMIKQTQDVLSLVVLGAPSARFIVDVEPSLEKHSRNKTSRLRELCSESIIHT